MGIMKPAVFRPFRCGIILAGGDGTRLQSFIHQMLGIHLPKQYINFIGTRSMLEHTFDRVEQVVSAERIFTVVSQDHLKFPQVEKQLENRLPQTVVVQPENRGTGPGLLLPLIHVLKNYPNSIVAVFPSDHFILPEDIFLAYVRQAFAAVESCPARIFLLGVEPTSIETDYGYILPDCDNHDPYSLDQNIKGFIEKPNVSAVAKVLLSDALWNTMVMVFRPRILLRLIELSNPKLYHSFERIYRSPGSSREMSAVEEIYTRMAPVDFSRDLLETFNSYAQNQLSVIPMKGVLWSDWGSEDRILSILKRLRWLDRLSCGYPLNEFRNHPQEPVDICLEA